MRNINLIIIVFAFTLITILGSILKINHIEYADFVLIIGIILLITVIYFVIKKYKSKKRINN